MRNVELKRYIINNYKITGAAHRALHDRRGTAVAFSPDLDVRMHDIL